MTFSARIAYWSNGLYMYPLDGLEADMAPHSWSARLTGDRRLVFNVSPAHGVRLSRADPAKQAGCEWRLRWIHFELPLPQFCIDSQELELSGDCDDLYWIVPPDHELPWLQRRPYDDESLEEAVRRNLRMRAESCRLAGGDLREVVRGVPPWAKGVLSGAEWMAIMEGREHERCT